jgi:alkanesulfonate monooxygenase
MSEIEFIGLLASREASEILPPRGAIVHKPDIVAAARAHEEAGFDKVLIGHFSAWPDGLQLATFASTVTERLAFLVAHRPGFVAPTVAARAFATLDHLSDGRVALHTITGGIEADQQRDGDFLDHDTRYARTDEYLEVLKKTWTSAAPFDHEGEFYRLRQAYAEVKPVQQPHIPLYFGGASDAAIAVAAKHADVYATFGETVARVVEIVGRVRNAAAAYGRTPRFSLSLRPILADTEEAAWARAERIYETARAARIAKGLPTEGHAPAAVGSQRLLETARAGARQDKRLWTAMAALSGAGGNSTSLVGTPDQVADALLDYHDVGITTFLIRGYNPIADAIDYGRSLIPAVRARLAEKARQRAAA